MQNLKAVRSEEDKDADETLNRLEMKRKEQEKVVRHAKRQHRMCVRELIENIVELESMQGAKVDQQMLQEIIEACPINIDLPQLDEIQKLPSSDSERAKDLIDSVESYRQLKQDKEAFLNERDLNSERIKSQEDRQKQA